ncbi:MULTISPECIES: MerR family transcriptional regulator [unclassified Clostridioides]|uniref:MerR family transcriptional regulator n=1 Tax=unclassified Clostridioides TaxID=2635829 RepID=UPI001D112B13|nr:MerR family transcriptional regulator [Clostridioides sp. ES-S-0049-03]MCC0675663.1 MerR family transcriptional regulator [Clostridioides sp. ES-W-0018-02]MCC0709528.1 MerR family transcriptional regulator [Clostridioides sp. ES-W-0017-02]
MEYTVQKLSKIAGISTRTLRYYDEIELLKPLKINSSGYRIYGQNEVNKLQQILFYRELGISLENIKNIINSPTFDSLNALKEHHSKLLAKRKQIDLLIKNVTKTIALKEGKYIMTDLEKFEGFKEKMIDENEKNYGTEIREKYGEDVINQSNRKFKNMSKKDYENWQDLSTEIISKLKKAFKTGDASNELSQEVVRLHHKWLSYTWNTYSKEAHAALAQMYLDDERFTSYYDKEQPGLAKFLRDSIVFYTR